MSEGSRSRSSSASTYSSISSTDSAKNVAMNKVEKTSLKKMRVTGVNGCTSMHLFGSNFIVGAHAEPAKIPNIARQAADSAGAGVTSIVVYAGVADDANRAQTELHRLYPQATISVKYYTIKDSALKGYWEFEATQGNPGVVSATYVS